MSSKERNTFATRVKTLKIAAAFEEGTEYQNLHEEWVRELLVSCEDIETCVISNSFYQSEAIQSGTCARGLRSSAI